VRVFPLFKGFVMASLWLFGWRLTLTCEYDVPVRMVHVTDHALKRFRERVPGGESVERFDVIQFVGDSELCSRRNYKLLRDSYRRRGLKWRGGEEDNVYRLYGFGDGKYVVFAVRLRPYRLCVVTCWVACDLFPNS